MKLFIDAMGGDLGPGTVIEGVADAARQLHSEIVLLGDESVLKRQESKLKSISFEIVHCPETIEMSESPVQAVRKKKTSSIVRGLELAAATPESAFFSAGHSGAVFAAALMAMGRIEGVERPAIATALPTLRHGRVILLDAGANVDCRPQHLNDFAVMGSIYAKRYCGKESPAVAILSNGEEESKGTELTRAAFELCKNDPRLNFIGYIEGKEITRGQIDVVVTDGFTGNVVLKSLEGLSSTLAQMVRRELVRNTLTKLGALLVWPMLRHIQKQIDYAEVGSAPLLGVDGNCFIGHGRSNARAIKNGILTAQSAIDLKLHDELRAQFAQHKDGMKKA